MSWPEKKISEATAAFHRIVETGSVADLQLVLAQGPQVNTPGLRDITAVMLAISAHDLEKLKLLIDHGADPELTDDLNVTALAYSVQKDFWEAVQFLLSLGVDRGYHPKYPLKKIEFEFDLPEIALPEQFKEVFTDESWKAAQKLSREMMKEIFRNPTVHPIVSHVCSVEVLKLFMEVGDNFCQAPSEIQRAMVGLESDGEFRCTIDDYRAHKSPSYGLHNPERMDFAFWKEMLKKGGNAYSARRHFNDMPFDTPGAVWCFERFGSSLTQLEDGRFVQIGGEHEDYYDPDFFIYNDVVIHDGKGDCQIYGYPKHIFPPTDFHTATLRDDSLYIIGCLGYFDQRQSGFTPVYRLQLGSWKIEPVKTFGENPGWIHRHRAVYDHRRNAICIQGGETHVVLNDGETQSLTNTANFELSLIDFRWTRVK